MSYFVKLCYLFVIPPGLYVTMAAALTIYAFWKKRRRLAWTLVPVTAIIYLSSCNVVGNSLLTQIGSEYPFPDRIEGDCIVVLGEGASVEVPSVDGQGELNGDMALNTIAAMKLYNKLHVPILLSGGVGIAGNGAGNEAQLARRDLIAMNVPESMILIEDKSRTTLENARFSAKLLQEHGFRKPVLVTTSPHMPRSVELFRQEGVDVLPLPTRYSPPQAIRYNVFDFIPSATGIFTVQQGLKETIGRMQHWFS